jgi:two-component system NarL family sensor kinase
LDEARRSIENLRPSALDNRALVEALSTLARQFTADTGVRVRAELSAVEPLSPEIETQVFYIATEALTNIRKHANAREVSLRLEPSRGNLRLTIEDDGDGFRVRGANRKGLGLRGIETRARTIGGRATFRSGAARGTRITVVLPVPHP